MAERGGAKSAEGVRISPLQPHHKPPFFFSSSSDDSEATIDYLWAEGEGGSEVNLGVTLQILRFFFFFFFFCFLLLGAWKQRPTDTHTPSVVTTVLCIGLVGCPVIPLLIDTHVLKANTKTIRLLLESKHKEHDAKQNNAKITTFFNKHY